MDMSTKDRIIEVLANLIKQDENINEIPISKIAELADIGKSTVYEHFDSKDDLIKETYVYLSDYYHKRIVAPLKHHTFEAAYKEITCRIMRNAQEANELMMSILGEGHNYKLMTQEDMKKMMDDIQKEVQEIYFNIIRMGISEGIVHLNPSESKEKGHIIRALTMGLIIQRMNENIDLSEKEALSYLYKYSVIILNT